MGILLTIITVQLAGALQTNRDLERQHLQIIESLSDDRAARSRAVMEIMSVQQDIQEAQTAIKPTLEDVVKEMRQLNQTLAIANAKSTSQIEMVGKALDMIADGLLPLVVAIFVGSKTPLGRRLLEKKKEDP